MKRVVAIIPATLFFPVFSLAQQQPSSAANSVVDSTIVMRVSSCPVDLQAKQGHDGGFVAVRNRGPEDPDIVHHPAQHIHLIVRNRKGDKRIAGATVTAHGLSARGRMLGADLNSAQPDLKRTLDLKFINEGDGTSSAELDLPAFTSVQSVKLDSITYDDGSTWKMPHSTMCSVVPDGVMLISSDRR